MKKEDAAPAPKSLHLSDMSHKEKYTSPMNDCMTSNGSVEARG